MAVQRLDLTGEATTFITLNDADNLGELGLIPFFPRRFARCATFLPFVHVEPLDMPDAHGRLHFRFALHEHGLNVAALDTDGYGYLVAANAWVSGGMLGQEGHDALAV